MQCCGHYLDNEMSCVNLNLAKQFDGVDIILTKK